MILKQLHMFKPLLKQLSKQLLKQLQMFYDFNSTLKDLIYILMRLIRLLKTLKSIQNEAVQNTMETKHVLRFFLNIHDKNDISLG